MSPLIEYIESGILELYVMGMTSSLEAAEVERMASAHPEIRTEIENISLAMEGYALAHAVKPRATVKPLLMATIEYIERLKNGEQPASPALLTSTSKISDYQQWLDRSDMLAPASFEGLYAKIIAATPEVTTGIVWISGMTDYEIHHDEHESFLIVEGTCDFIIGEEVHSLVPGDFLAIPLHKPHWARITSAIPCKAIIQRRAA